MYLIHSCSKQYKFCGISSLSNRFFLKTHKGSSNFTSIFLLFLFLFLQLDTRLILFTNVQ